MNPMDHNPDDDICYVCTMHLGEATTFTDNGYCSEECAKAKHSIPLIRPMYNVISEALGTPEHWNHGFIRYAELPSRELFTEIEKVWSSIVYKETECGAWMDVPDPQTVRIGSIVEGTDAETQTVSLKWPFNAEMFWNAVRDVENEADIIWHEWNDEETT